MAYQNDQPSLRLSMLIIAAATISTSLAQPDLLDLPIRRLLKEELGASQSQMALLFGIGALAWYLKPIAGLLVDSVALFGTYRRYYLIISALVAGALWVFLGLVSHSYSLLLAAVIAMQCMLVIGSTVLGGFLVERGKLLMAEGRLVSCRMFVEHACDLIAGPLSGYLAGLTFGTATLIGAAIAVVSAPIAAVGVTEPVQKENTLVGAKYLFSDIKSMLNSRTIWLVAIFSLIASIPQSFGTPLYFYQKNILAFSDVEIGYLTAVAGLGGLLGSALYQFLCRQFPMQWLLLLGTLGSSMGIAGYLFYASFPGAVIVEFASGFLFAIGTLGVMQSAVISTLGSSAAFGFAVFMSASNVGAAVGDNLAALLVERLSMTLSDLVKAFAAASGACCLLVLILPRSLLNHREGKLPFLEGEQSK
jgi:Na+/melibiose symporter-like transporter